MRESFEEYVTARGDRLLRFAYVLCGDGYLAEDLVRTSWPGRTGAGRG